MSDAIAFAALGAAVFLAGFLFGRRMPRRPPSGLVIKPSSLHLVAPLPGSRTWEGKR
jgi:hypothetical protein